MMKKLSGALRWGRQERVTRRHSQTCSVAQCSATPLVTVASKGSAVTLMCNVHARQWVGSERCWRVAEDGTAGIEARLTSWTRDMRGEAGPPALQPSLHSL